MSLTRAHIDAMIASGCTAEQIGAVVKIDIQERARALTDRRAKDAERQRRHRESRDVTVTPCDSVTDPALSRPPNDNNSNPPTHTHPNTQPRARKGHRLPSNWEPEPLKSGLAKDIATWPPGAMERELARFRDWAASATGPNATKSDWQAAWRNWLRKAHDEGRYLKHGNDIRRSGATGPDKRSGLARAIDSELERLSAFP